MLFSGILMLDCRKTSLAVILRPPSCCRFPWFHRTKKDGVPVERKKGAVGRYPVLKRQKCPQPRFLRTPKFGNVAPIVQTHQHSVQRNDMNLNSSVDYGNIANTHKNQ
jgi:hypothetical protein